MRRGKRLRVSLGTADPEVAWLIAVSKLRAFELGRAGLMSEAKPHRPLSEVIGDYRTELERRGDGVHHVRESKRLLEAIAAETGPTLETWTTETIARALAKLWSDKARTQNKARTAAKGLSKMLVDRDELARNPVDRIPRARVVRKRIRRDLARHELHAVLGAVPLYRQACYVTALTTGLRRNELKTRATGDVDCDRAALALDGDAAKNRRAATLHLPPIAVKILRRYLRSLGNVPPTTPLFKVPLIATWKKDLIRAGVEYRTARGVVDFHALRGTFITNLSRRRRKGPAASLEVVRDCARHADVQQTAAYIGVDEEERKAAVDAGAALWAKSCPKPRPGTQGAPVHTSGKEGRKRRSRRPPPGSPSGAGTV